MFPWLVKLTLVGACPWTSALKSLRWKKVRERAAHSIHGLFRRTLTTSSHHSCSHQQYLSRTRRPRTNRSCQSAPTFTGAGTFLAANTVVMWTRRSTDLSNLARPRLHVSWGMCFSYASKECVARQNKILSNTRRESWLTVPCCILTQAVL
jgi:hypothetical protein